MRTIKEMDLRFLTRVRTGIEIDMAKTLYALFNDQPIIGVLRNGVSSVLKDVINDIDYGSKAFTGEADLLRVFKRAEGKGKEALASVLKNVNSWSASDCSDLIRLIATLLEKGGQGFVKGQGTKAITTAKQLGDQFKPASSFANVLDPKAADWSGRSRIGDDKLDAKYVYGAKHVEGGRSQISVERMVLGATESTRDKAFYGIKGAHLMPQSTVRKIDTAFGLPLGADISGTTADSVIVFKMFSKVLEDAGKERLPEGVLQLLPLATMVSLGHHTVVESAMTLTLSNFINYSIGFYSTLMPNPTNRSNVDEDVSGRMMRALRNAESHQGNVHFICYKAGDTYEGVVFETDDELETFRKIGWVADPFRAKMGTLTPEVLKGDLLHVAGELAQRRLKY